MLICTNWYWLFFFKKTTTKKRESKIDKKSFLKVLQLDLMGRSDQRDPAFPAYTKTMRLGTWQLAEMQLKIGILGLRQLSHLAYSPDLAPFDIAFFPSIKLQLKEQRYDDLLNFREKQIKSLEGILLSWFSDIITSRKSKAWLYVNERRRHHWSQNMNCTLWCSRLGSIFNLAISLCTSHCWRRFWKNFTHERLWFTMIHVLQSTNLFNNPPKKTFLV